MEAISNKRNADIERFEVYRLNVLYFFIRRLFCQNDICALLSGANRAMKAQLQ